MGLTRDPTFELDEELPNDGEDIVPSRKFDSSRQEYFDSEVLRAIKGVLNEDDADLIVNSTPAQLIQLSAQTNPEEEFAGMGEEELKTYIQAKRERATWMRTNTNSGRLGAWEDVPFENIPENRRTKAYSITNIVIDNSETDIARRNTTANDGKSSSKPSEKNMLRYGSTVRESNHPLETDNVAFGEYVGNPRKNSSSKKTEIKRLSFPKTHPMGADVKPFGLTGMMKFLNGQVGTVVGYDANSKKYKLKVTEEGETQFFDIKEMNIPQYTEKKGILKEEFENNENKTTSKASGSSSFSGPITESAPASPIATHRDKRANSGSTDVSPIAPMSQTQQSFLSVNAFSETGDDYYFNGLNNLNNGLNNNSGWSNFAKKDGSPFDPIKAGMMAMQSMFQSVTGMNLADDTANSAGPQNKTTGENSYAIPDDLKPDDNSTSLPPLPQIDDDIRFQSIFDQGSNGNIHSTPLKSIMEEAGSSRNSATPKNLFGNGEMEFEGSDNDEKFLSKISNSNTKESTKFSGDGLPINHRASYYKDDGNNFDDSNTPADFLSQKNPIASGTLVVSKISSSLLANELPKASEVSNSYTDVSRNTAFNAAVAGGAVENDDASNNPRVFHHSYKDDGGNFNDSNTPSDFLNLNENMKKASSQYAQSNAFSSPNKNSSSNASPVKPTDISAISSDKFEGTLFSETGDWQWPVYNPNMKGGMSLAALAGAVPMPNVYASLANGGKNGTVSNKPSPEKHVQKGALFGKKGANGVNNSPGKGGNNTANALSSAQGTSYSEYLKSTQQQNGTNSQNINTKPEARTPEKRDVGSPGIGMYQRRNTPPPITTHGLTPPITPNNNLGNADNNYNNNYFNNMNNQQQNVSQQHHQNITVNVHNVQNVFGQTNNLNVPKDPSRLNYSSNISQRSSNVSSLTSGISSLPNSGFAPPGYSTSIASNPSGMLPPPLPYSTTFLAPGGQAPVTGSGSTSLQPTPPTLFAALGSQNTNSSGINSQISSQTSTQLPQFLAPGGSPILPHHSTASFITRR